MGKRKAQTKNSQITDSPKKQKVEEGQTEGIEKSKRPRAAKAKKLTQPPNNQGNENKAPEAKGEQNKKQKSKQALKKNKKSLKAKVVKAVSSQETQNQPEKNVQLIPPELAKNLNKRQKQAISKKIKGLVKIREARGEELIQEEIYNIAREIIKQKSGDNDNKKQNGANANKEQKALKKKKKSKN